VIAALTFAAGGGVRPARFVPHADVPLDAACVVANGVREALRAVLGERCAVRLGEPVALDPGAWRALVADALVFAQPGRATDVAFVLARRDARRLVDAAFGEEGSPHGQWSALEHQAVERIVGRCAPAADVLCVERQGPARAVDPARLPACAAYFDVRVSEPIRLILGVGLLRALPPTPPAATLAPAVVGDLALKVRAILGSGCVPAARLLDLRIGDVVMLGTKVADTGELKVGAQRIAGGVCGTRRGWAAFAVRTVDTRGDAL
jgi:hypothetical protein